MLIWIIASLFAFFVKGLCGFANTLVFTSILSLGNDNISISPVELLLGYPTNCIIAFRERKYIRAKICIPISVLVILGSILGVLILKKADGRIIKIACGFVLMVVACEMLFKREQKERSQNSRIILYLVGFLSGILCGLYGIGALLGAYFAGITEDSREFKANICVVFLVENTFRIILYVALGIMNLKVLKTFLLLVPFMLLGLFCGMKSSRMLNEKTVGKIVVVMILVSGAFLIATNI